jgi:hypothetical protein
MNRSIVLSLTCAGVILVGCGEQKESGSKPSSSDSVVDAPANYVQGAVNAGQTAKGTVELITIRKAIEQYQQQEGSNPPSLNDLLQKQYLKFLPPPPAGQQFDYNPADGSVQLVAQ